MTPLMTLIMLTSTIIVVSSSYASSDKHSLEHSRSTVKPGANVTLSHNYDGHTALSETEVFSLTLTPASPRQGHIDIALNPEPALVLQSQRHFTQPLTGKPVVIPITISALEEGTHYLGIHVITTSLSGARQARVLELALPIGDMPRDPLKTNTANEQKSSDSAPDSGIIIMPSREKINQEY